MIRGVTKSIVEIRPGNHDYYEKVILILKDTPECPSKKQLEQYAALIFNDIPSSMIRNRKSRFLTSLILILCSSVISISACLIVSLFV